MRRRLIARLRAEWEPLHRPAPADTFSLEPMVLLAAAAALLTLLEFHGTAAELGGLLVPLARAHVPLAASLLYGRWFELASYAYWSLACLVCYGVVPALLLRRLRPGEPLSSFGLTFAGLRGHVRTYVVLYLLVLPLVALAATRPEFLQTYPFYRHAGRSALDFALWEACYALQFLALEFFFRGFLVHGLKRALGVYAIAVAAVPYCMIHFAKPLPEALAAIVAGLVLGTLSLRTGSVMGGAALHVAVALTMDAMALVRAA